MQKLKSLFFDMIMGLEWSRAFSVKNGEFMLIKADFPMSASLSDRLWNLYNSYKHELQTDNFRISKSPEKYGAKWTINYWIKNNESAKIVIDDKYAYMWEFERAYNKWEAVYFSLNDITIS